MEAFAAAFLWRCKVNLLRYVSCVASLAIAAACLLAVGWRAAAADNANNQEVVAKAAVAADAVLLAGCRLVDLTHAFDERTIYWPTEIPFHLERGFAGITEGGWYYSANRFHMAEHSGTHVDAPIHFYKDHQTVDQIPLERLIGPAVVVDVAEQCRANADFQITTASFEDWERQHGHGLEGAIVLLRTGYGQFWPERKRYLGTDENGAQAVAKLHFPGLEPEAAAWLVANRRIKAVGIDTASIDHGQSKTFGTHVILCQHNTPALENVANLAELPEQGFTVVALPMKIRGGSGGPTRVIAILPK
ncbi:MAG: cyclase family protein [Planctomycetia bacterium]|nr:cyclase family protein [Planctomycetia bacterium]